MSLQINQYTKTRTAATITLNDLLDFDSTDDAGLNYESAKCKVSEFLDYINDNVDNLYSTNGTLTSERTINGDGNNLILEQSNLVLKPSDGASSKGYYLNDNSDTEQGSFYYSHLGTGVILDIKNSGTTYLRANAGFVGIGGNTSASQDEVLNVDGNVIFENSILSLNTTDQTARLNIKTNSVSVSDSYLNILDSASGVLLHGKNDGFLGIGTSTKDSDETLNVQGTIYAQEQIRIDNTSLSTAIRVDENANSDNVIVKSFASLIMVNGGAVVAKSQLYVRSGSNLDYIVMNRGADSSNLTFDTEDASGAETIKYTEIGLKAKYWDGSASQEVDSTLRFRAESTGGLASLRYEIDSSEHLRVEQTDTEFDTSLYIYDHDNATLERVTVGAADSGGTGYKLLRIPN